MKCKMYPCLYNVRSRVLVTNQTNAIWYFWVERLGASEVMKTVNKIRAKGKKVSFRDFHVAICKERRIEF